MTNPSLPYHFPDGTDVLIDPHIEPEPADFVAVACVENGGGIVVKRLVREYQQGRAGDRPAYSLVSLNPVYAPIPLDGEQHRVIGVVVDSRLPSYIRSQARAM
ncbi:S24 family peptidase [Comamonadaceae bacterium OH2545_COT-014]|nr:S24 family peptidase [Comamonadaceae bacterium OH2545_COT-014]